jgi:alkylation response protein AidB-like acyl-CoA dehydrogenase
MDFNFTSEQNMLRDSLARLIRDTYDFDTRRSAIRSPSGWRPELWAQFAEMGLFMAPFSEEDGGLGGGPVDAMLIMEEFGKGLVVEPFIPSVVCAGGFLKHAGTPDQKAEHLSAIMDGSRVFAFAWAEPQGRFDPFDVTTRATREGSGFTLSGRKAVVVGAPWASHIIVTARTGGASRDTSGLSVFIVDKSAPGITTRDYTLVDGRRASEVQFDAVILPPEALIGEADAALPLINRVIDESIAAICAEAVGAMGRLHAITVDYSKTRKQFGQPIGRFQVLQHRLVDMFMEYEQSVSMTYMATLRLNEPPAERARAASAAKVRIAQAARFVGQNAVQIHGGIGVTDELNTGHYFKRLSMIEAEFGDAAHHLRRYTALTAPDAVAAE